MKTAEHNIPASCKKLNLSIRRFTVYIKQIRFISISGVVPLNVLNELFLSCYDGTFKSNISKLRWKVFFILFYMEFQLYTCKIGKDLERSYAVYARSLGSPESQTVTKWIKSCLLQCFGTFKMPILMFISILVFRPEGQIWNPVRRDTRIYVRRILNASRISKTQLNSCTISPS